MAILQCKEPLAGLLLTLEISQLAGRGSTYQAKMPSYPRARKELLYWAVPSFLLISHQ